MSLSTAGWSIKGRPVEYIYKGDYSFEDVISDLYQAINCEGIGLVFRDASMEELAIVAIGCSQLSTLKKGMLEFDGHAYEIMSAMVHYIESNKCKDTAIFILG